MAKKFENKKGFLIIEMNKDEAKSLGFGLYEDGTCICIGCNDLSRDKIYYVAVLNDTMCEKCVNNFIQNTSRYDEDIPYETRNFERYSKILNI